MTYSLNANEVVLKVDLARWSILQSVVKPVINLFFVNVASPSVLYATDGWLHVEQTHTVDI